VENYKIGADWSIAFFCVCVCVWLGYRFAEQICVLLHNTLSIKIQQY